MPFGIDDTAALLITLTTSAAAWAKRGDILQTNVKTVVSACTGDDRHAEELGIRAKSFTKTPPSFLLPGFDVRDGPSVPHRSVSSSSHLMAPSTDAASSRAPPLQSSRSWIRKPTPVTPSNRLDAALEEGTWRAALRLAEPLRSSITTAQLERLVGKIMDEGPPLLGGKVLVDLFDGQVLSERLVGAVMHEASSKHVQTLVAVLRVMQRMYDHLPLSLQTDAFRHAATHDWRLALTMMDQLSWQPDAPVSPVVLPFAAQYAPQRVPEVTSRMLQYESNVAEESLLNSLGTMDAVRPVVHAYLSSKRQSPYPSAWGLALQLFQLKPTVDTLCSAMQRMTPSTASQLIQPMVQCLPTIAIQRVLPSLPSVGERMATNKAPISSWLVSMALVSHLLHRRCYPNLVALGHDLCSHGRWTEASRVFTLSLTNPQVQPTAFDLSSCIHCAVQGGRWSSALFWVERAHAANVHFSPEMYDDLLHVGGKCSWVSSMRLLLSMRSVGAHCTEKGLMDVLEVAAASNQSERALHLLTLSNSVAWSS